MGMEHAALACVLGLILMWMSRNQPFPEVSRRFGIILLMLGFLGLLSESAPRPTTDRVWLITYTGLGGLGVVIGMRHMTHTRMDVLIAPASGFLLCIGVIGLLWNEWRVLSEFEQIASFLLASFLCMGEVYLVFRGLLIGKLPQSWSQAGLRNLQRGILDGPNGAISCFEKAWDVEKEHLNPMAYLALQRIFYARGDSVNADEWALKLAENGGKNAVDEAWIKAVDDSLKRLGMDFEQEE
ncbi:MAG: hypothetical protein HN696_04300 [Euryarchaeota archaeon]|nr:hypothetical protein [Euryarchaeota archaeon]